MPIDVDEFLKQARKRPDIKPRPSPEGVTSPAEKESATGRLARGVGAGLLKGGAAAAYGTAELGKTVAGSTFPDAVKLLRQIPGLREKVRKLNEFAESKSSGMPEDVGKFIGEVAPLMLIPGMGEEALAVGLTGRGLNFLRGAAMVKNLPVRNPVTGRMMAVPPTRVPGAGALPGWAPAATSTAGAIGRGAEAAQKGAVAGAIANPKDPLTGAEEGALGGVASRAAPAVAGFAAPYAALPFVWRYHLPWGTAHKIGDVASSVVKKVSPPAGYGVAEARGNYLSDLARVFMPEPSYTAPVEYEPRKPTEDTDAPR